MLIDTHCHLTDERLADIEGVLKQARDAGVEKVIMPSTSVEDAKKALVIAESFGQYCLVGIHPEEAGKFGDLQGVSSQDDPQDFVSTLNLQGRLLWEGKHIEEMEKIIKSSERVVGVGEIGMDFHYDSEHKTEQKQRELFRAQMEMAVRNNLPVAIHMRDAEEEMREELRALHAMPLRGQFHCFAGSEEFLKVILEMGFYVSFGGNITYKSAGSLRDLLKLVPRNRLLLETDSPYLPPEPRRGTVNTPANVKITAEFVARELGISFEEIAKTTSQNAICLYSLDI